MRTYICVAITNPNAYRDCVLKTIPVSPQTPDPQTASSDFKSLNPKPEIPNPKGKLPLLPKNLILSLCFTRNPMFELEV